MAIIGKTKEWTLHSFQGKRVTAQNNLWKTDWLIEKIKRYIQAKIHLTIRLEECSQLRVSKSTKKDW